MISLFTKYFTRHFIPHEGNEHRPHILRGDSTRYIVAFIIFFEVFSFVIPTLMHLNTTGNMAAVLPAVLSSLTNEERETQNLAILTVNPILNKAAEMKAQDMATNGYFAHTSPDGKNPWYWLKQAGYQYQYAGENLAINFSDSKDVTDAWMQSPTHKKNIIKGNYTEVGTGVATGMYEGHETVFVAQVYANPMPEIFQPIEIKKTPTIVTEKKVVSATKEEPNNVLGAEVTTNTENIPVEIIQKPTFMQKLLSSPRNTTNMILYIIFGIIALALVLYIFIKIKNHHIDLITNGLVVLAMIGAIFVINYYSSYASMAVTQSLNYSIQSE